MDELLQMLVAFGLLAVGGLALAGLVLLPLGLLDLRRRMRAAELRAERLDRRLEELLAGRAEADRQSADPGPAEVPEAPEEAALRFEAVGDGPPPWVESTAPEHGDSGLREPGLRGPDLREPARRVPASAGAGAEPAEGGVDWERWIGVRGAGLLGGLVAALAAILLFVHAVQEGWVSPAVRVTSGAAFGLAALFGSGVLHRRGYRPAADGLLGAGATAWFAAAWASFELYELVPRWMAFAAMALATVVALDAAHRRRSQVSAAITLLGGFATPLLLDDGTARPWTLFGFVGLLDIGLLVLARSLRSAWIAPLAVVGTLLLQALWFEHRFEPEHGLVAVGITSIFGLLLGLGADASKRQAEPLRWITLAPLPLAPAMLLYFGSRSSVELDPWLLVGQIVLLMGAAGVVAERHRAPILRVWVTLACLALTWFVFVHSSTDDGVTLAGPAAVLAVGWLSIPRRTSLPGLVPRLAGALGGLGAIAIGTLAGAGLGLGRHLLVSGLTEAAAVSVAIALARAGGRRAMELAIAAACLPLPLLLMRMLNSSGYQNSGALFAWMFLLLGLSAWALRRPKNHELSLAPAVGVVSATACFAWTMLVVTVHSVPGWSVAGGLLAFGMLALLIAERHARGGTLALTVLVIGLATASVLLGDWYLSSGDRTATVASDLLPMGLCVVAVLLGPSLVQNTSRSILTALARLVVAQVSVIQVSGAVDLIFELSDEGIAGIATAIVGLPLAGAIALGARRQVPFAVTSLLTLSLGSVVGFGIAEALGEQEPALWASAVLFAAGLLCARRRHPLPVGVGLVFAPPLALGLAYQLLQPWNYERTTRFPFDALTLALLLIPLGPVCFARFTHWPLQRVVAGISAGLSVWVSLSALVLLAFSPLGSLSAGVAAEGATGLALSLSWAAYAIALLALGLRTGSLGLRRASLVVLLGTLAKVFLIDLGDLEGLTRVASLAGLATSLILVSLAYQRFVFGDQES